MTIVTVSARPYAAAMCSDLRKMSSTATVATHSTTLTVGMYSCPRVRAG